MGKFANKDEGVGVRIGPPVELEGDNGFAALGKPVPFYRRAAAYEHAKQMGCADGEKTFRCIERMCLAIERDNPHEAMETALGHKANPHGIVDVTGVYRLLAVLLTATLPPLG